MTNKELSRELEWCRDWMRDVSNALIPRGAAAAVELADRLDEAVRLLEWWLATSPTPTSLLDEQTRNFVAKVGGGQAPLSAATVAKVRP